jgi:hypothetical protein
VDGQDERSRVKEVAVDARVQALATAHLRALAERAAAARAPSPPPDPSAPRPPA